MAKHQAEQSQADTATAEETSNTLAAETGSNQLTVQGIIFTAPHRYSEGHVLVLAEARQLQQCFREALRNNFSSAVKKALKDAGKEKVEELTEEAKAKLHTDFATYAESFQFATRSSVTRSPVDPVEREAIRLVTPLVRKVLADRKIDVKTLAEGVFDKLIAQALSKRPDILAEAQRRVDASKSIANLALDTTAA